MVMNIRDKVIFVNTVQHTGTWFVIDFLRAHSKFSDIVEWRNVRHLSLKDNDKKVILHKHLPDPIEKDSGFFNLCLPELFKTVVPLRDPLRAVITKYRRHPEYDFEEIISGFL